MTEKSLIDKIVDIDERYVYLLIFIILSVPLLKPLGLPLVVTEQPKKTFNYIEALEPGSIVVYGYDASAITYMDQGPAAEAVLKHLLKKPGIKIIGFTISAEGSIFWERALKKIGTYGKEYGKDYVWLGFVPGHETGLAAVASDTWRAVGGKDAYGTPLEQLSLMAEFHSAKDADLVINMCFGGTGFFAWLRQWQTAYNLPFIIVPLGAETGTYISFLRAGQIYSWVAGTRQAAEYELLIKEPGPILGTMDAQSIAHLFTIALMIIGNIFFVFRRKV